MERTRSTHLSIPAIAARAALAVLLLLTASCEATNAADEICEAGASCTCSGDAPCMQDCDGEGCTFKCTGSGSCDLTCEQGGCAATVTGSGAATLHCPGNGCELNCEGSGSCELTGCKQGCTLTCANPMTTCVQTCNDESCTTNTPEG